VSKSTFSYPELSATASERAAKTTSVLGTLALTAAHGGSEGTAPGLIDIDLSQGFPVYFGVKIEPRLTASIHATTGSAGVPIPGRSPRPNWQPIAIVANELGIRAAAFHQWVHRDQVDRANGQASIQQNQRSWRKRRIASDASKPSRNPPHCRDSV